MKNVSRQLQSSVTYGITCDQKNTPCAKNHFKIIHVFYLLFLNPMKLLISWNILKISSLLSLAFILSLPALSSMFFLRFVCSSSSALTSLSLHYVLLRQ